MENKLIVLTPKAVAQIRKLQIEDESARNATLRIEVVGGGCSGMSYKMSFDPEPTDKDNVSETDGVKVVVDPKSALFIAGLELDFSDGLNGTGFTFSNPNAKRTCGCGTSFSA